MNEPKLYTAVLQCVHQDKSKTANGCIQELEQTLVVFLSSNLYSLMYSFVSDDRDYRHYLGAEFLKAIEEVECFRSSSSALAPHLLTAAILASHVLLPFRNIF